MKRTIVFLLLFAFFVQPLLYGQLDIRVNVDKFEDDTLYLGYYYGNKKYFYDTLTREKDEFRLTADTLAPRGMYLLLNKELKKYHDQILEDDQEFRIQTDSSFSMETVSFKGTEINSDFYDYIRMISELKPKAGQLQEELPDPSAREKLDKLNARVKEAQQALIDKYPGSLLAATIQSSMEMEIPDFEGSAEEVKMKKYRYFKNHYFDQIDISEEKMIRAPFFYPYVNRYIKKVVPQHPDSIIDGLDKVLQPMLESKSESFKFFLVHYLNHFARSKIVGMDAVYVHLVNEYYKTGKAWWTEEKQLQKILDEVEKIEPTLIGKIAPQITVKRLDNGESLNLHEIESPYTVLLFWDPECGHCKKAMPGFIEFYENYKGKGVKMVAVCTKLNQDAREKCLDYIDERENMDIFTNVYDPFLRSRYKQKYDIRTTPRVYILNDEKEIIMKGIPAEKMSEVMDQIMTADEKKAAQKLK